MKKYSKKWMQTFVQEKFPENNNEIIEKISKHAFEVESVENTADDSLFEIKVLPNRVSDAFCLRGMAREFATVFDLPTVELKSTEMFNDISAFPRNDDFVQIENGATKCYFGISVEIDKQIETPAWIKDIIEKSGGRSINSLVDLTNLMLYSFGQPTHVFDLEKIDGKIITRTAKPGEKITLLDGKVLELKETENLICSKSEKGENVLALAGIKGGKEAEVDEKTTKAFFEIANFESGSVRATSLKQNIRTDASKIYENSLSTHTTEEVLIILVNSILEVYPQAKINFIAKKYFDPVHENFLTENKNKIINFTTEDASQKAGIVFQTDEIVKILKRLNFTILEQKENNFSVQAHGDRLDINIKEDLLEETLRVFGFDNIPSVPLKVLDNSLTYDNQFLLENFLKVKLSELGFTEVYNYTFVEKGDLKVLLPLSEDKSYLRNNLLSGMTVAYQKNYNYLPILQTEVVKFFELGSVFSENNEERRMAICLDDGKKKSKYLGDLETVLASLASELGISKIEIINKNEKPAMIEFSLDKIVSELESKNIKLPYLELAKKLADIKYKPISIYPFIVRDIAMWVPDGFDFANLKNKIESLNLQNFEKMYMFDSFTKTDESGKTKSSIAFRIIFQSYTQTLTDQEVEQEMNKVVAYLNANGFEIR